MDSQQSSDIRIEKLPPFSVVGPACEVEDGTPTKIFELWQGFDQAERPASYSGVWGLCWGTGENSFHYIAGFVVPHGTKAPEGQEARTFPGLKYAVFPFHGTPPEMGMAFMDIFKIRLPAAGLTPQPDGLCIEMYPPEPMDAEGKLSADLYVAVQ